MRRSWSKKAGPLLAALLLASCSSAVDAVRSVTGASKNDPGPTARNTQNLEAGSERPYPNLGTVPPPPVRALSTAEREALQKSLAADRANAKYIDEQLRAGQTASAPRPAHPAPRADETAEATPAPAEPAPAPLRPLPQQASPAPSAAAPLPTTAAPPPEPAPAAAPRTPVEAQELANEAPATPPEVRSLPQPETPAAAPPPPVIAGPGAPPPAARPAPSPTPSVAAVPAAPPAAAPAPRAAAPAPPSAPARPAQQLAAIPPGQPAAEIAFASDSASLPAPGRSRLAQVAATQRERGGTVRIVTEAAPAGGTTGALAAFGLALDRANAVALALAEAGVPQGSIQVETAPPGAAPGRARVYLQN